MVNIDIKDYDWNQAFGYAGQLQSGELYSCMWNSGAPIKAAPHINVSESTFTINDVVETIAVREGENDGRNWICVGKLNDGRWFSLDAGCDYTGWD